MDIRPQDLPELRAELARFAPRLTDAGKDRLTQLFDGESPLKSLKAIARDSLLRAELFWASQEMVGLAATASDSLPSFVVQREDLPAPMGLLAFERPLRMPDPAGEIPVSIRGILWAAGERRVIVMAYWDREQQAADADYPVRPGLPLMVAAPAVMFGVDFGDAGWRDLGPRTGPRMLFPVLMSAWLLMQQPLADTSEVEADRAARKRLRRLGQEPAPVRVIELRRPKHSGGEPGESGRNYTHRWITRGHWRQQWYASRQVHRPVWIAPHVKGPEGAPMIGGEKVYAWKR